MPRPEVRISWLGVSIVGMLVVGLSVPAIAHHRPNHPTPPGHQTTTTTEGTTSSTTTTTSTSVPSTTTTTQATTTTTAATTTTTSAPPTTTIAPTTTTTSSPGQTINLSADWHITTDEWRSNFTVNGNGHAIHVHADVTWTNFTIDNVERVMWHEECGVAHLASGQVTNSGVANTVGAYPLHWHLCGNATRGSTVTDVHVENSANHAFVPHGSHGITFTDISANDVNAAALWWDRPGTNETCSFPKFCTLDNSNDIVVDGFTFTDIHRHPGSDGRRNQGVQLGAGSGNVIRNGHVGQVEGGRDCAAYSWPESANQNVGGNVWVFENNSSAIQTDPDCHGIFVWQNDSNLHIIDGFTGDRVFHGAYVNDYQYRNLNVERVSVLANGSDWADSHLGDATMGHHSLSGDPITFTNVTFDSFTVNDGGSGINDPDPGVYILTDTNMTCATIQYGDVHPDSRVVVDGQDC